MSSNNRNALSMQGLEPLEPRSLFSSYLFHSPADAFGVNVPIHDLQAPGIDVLGFGAFVAALGDIDGDGFGDFAVSSTGAAPEGGGIIAQQQGQVFLYSGHTASQIRTLNDGAWEFGASFANVGDLNDDGVPDLLVGSPRFDSTDNSISDPTGRAYVYSGIDGAILRTIEGATPFGDFGRVVSGLNDANADDVQDFIVSAPGTTADLTGSVFIYSGADAALLRTFNGEAAGDRFGAAIAVVSDDVVDHDLFAVGAPFNDTAFEDAGRAYVYRNDGMNVLAMDGTSAGEQFGSALAIARTLQSIDPLIYIHRLIAGSPGFDGVNNGNQRVDSGRVTSFELATGAARTITEGSITSGARFGARLTAITDFTTPGRQDIAVVAPGTGQVYTFDPELAGLNGMQPLAVTSSVLGSVIAGAGDVNNDGIVDVISADGNGRVTIVSSLAVGRPLAFSGASPDGRYVWMDSYYTHVLFIDGVARSYSNVPGLSVASRLDPKSPTSHILAIGNDGAIVFVNTYLDGSPPSELMVNVGGQVATLQSMITATEGEQPTDFVGLKVVDISDGGHILLTETMSRFPSSATRSWIFSGGTLSFLWSGFAFDVNTSGAVVGQRQQQGSPAESVLWTHDSGITVVPELDGSLLINDAGQIFGTRHNTATTTTPGTISRWDAGVVTDITAGPEFGGGLASVSWILRAVDSGGRIIADVLTVSTFAAPQITTYIFQPGDGLRTFEATTHGAPQLQ
ncbi:MAG: FG-GAP repeat protein, partial [Pyrinomonadaceae bacterium]|nr:FG-GAP repeat protein [Phycisphaerales bacterium]